MNRIDKKVEGHLAALARDAQQRPRVDFVANASARFLKELNGDPDDQKGFDDIVEFMGKMVGALAQCLVEETEKRVALEVVVARLELERVASKRVAGGRDG